MADIDEQLRKAEARVKRLKQRKQQSEAKKAIAENKSLREQLNKQVAEAKSLNEQLKNKNAESLANSRDYQQVMGAVKKLFDDVQGKKFFMANYTDKNKNNHAMIKVEDVQKRLQQIINLQK